MLRYVILLVVLTPLLANQALARAQAPDRGVVAVRRGDGSIYIGWRLLSSDPGDVAFHIYCQAADEKRARRVTERPVVDTTDFVLPAQAGPARFHVRPVVRGREGRPSLAAELVDPTPGGAWRVIRLAGPYAAFQTSVADLDGDGRTDYLIKQPNFSTDPYGPYWEKSPEPYKLEAYRHDGRLLWRHEMGWSIETGTWYAPVMVYDLDGDGRAEVYTKAGEGDPRPQEGKVEGGAEYLVRLDGRTGKVTRRIPWPDRSGFDNYNHWSRNTLGVAYLDGKRPHLIVIRGTYRLIKVEAYDRNLKQVWRWSTPEEDQGAGMHGMHAADVDGDGRDEVVVGSLVVDDDGKLLWSLKMGHPDVVYVGDLDPGRPGLEIFYGFEKRQTKNGLCLVDAKTGAILWGWDGATRHIHGQGMAADILAEHPGQELYGGERDQPRERYLFTVAGKRLPADGLGGGTTLHTLFWDADPQKEPLRETGIEIPKDARLQVIGDLFGDWREEVITAHPGELRVHTTTIPAQGRRPWLIQNRLYRTGVARTASGYFFPPQLGPEK